MAWNRLPKTCNAKRAAICDDHDGIVPIRPKRKNLPDDWDDMPRGDRKHRSWKRHRKYQYKGEQMSEPRRAA